MVHTWPTSYSLLFQIYVGYYHDAVPMINPNPSASIDMSGLVHSTVNISIDHDHEYQVTTRSCLRVYL